MNRDEAIEIASETLRVDAESSAFDPALRAQIREALDTINQHGGLSVTNWFPLDLTFTDPVFVTQRYNEARLLGMAGFDEEYTLANDSGYTERFRGSDGKFYDVMLTAELRQYDTAEIE